MGVEQTMCPANHGQFAVAAGSTLRDVRVREGVRRSPLRGRVARSSATRVTRLGTRVASRSRQERHMNTLYETAHSGSTLATRVNVVRALRQRLATIALNPA